MLVVLNNKCVGRNEPSVRTHYKNGHYWLGVARRLTRALFKQIELNIGHHPVVGVVSPAAGVRHATAGVAFPAAGSVHFVIVIMA